MVSEMNAQDRCIVALKLLSDCSVLGEHEDEIETNIMNLE